MSERVLSMNGIITLVSRDGRNISFLKVTKRGRKYIYGRHVYREDGQIKEFSWEDKIDPSEYVILPGMREDLEKAYLEYLDALDKWEETKRRTLDELRLKAWDWIEEQLKLWEQQNPRPQNPLEEVIK
ncbi:MAG: hypothetical protein J7L79_01510 [Thaumarchaeota archaeon]|nr:hypothetical protein [Nitrososphaerota archaeon]